MEQQNRNTIDQEADNDFNFKQQLERYLVHWKWFVISALIFMAGAFIYLRYATPEYSISAKVLIKDDKKGGIGSELGSFGDLAALTGVKSNVDNELEVLKSRTLVQKTVRDLNLNISYFSDGRIKTSELYTSSPYKVQFFDLAEDFDKKDTTFVVVSNGSNAFTLEDSEGTRRGSYKFGSAVSMPFAKLVVLQNQLEDNSNSSSEATVMVRLSKLEHTTNKYVSKLKVDAINKTSSVLSLSMVDPVKELGVDFINRLITNYNNDAINDKNLVARNTEAFINKRLSSITKELDTVEGAIESFKKENRVTDIVSEAQAFLNSATDYQKEYLKIQTKRRVVDDVMQKLNKTTNQDLIPSNLVPDQGNISSLIDQYNLMVLNKDRLLIDASPENPAVRNIELQLTGLRQSIKQSLQNLQNSLDINERDLRRQGNILGVKISEIPTQEREARVIGRKQSVKEALYLYLLQKREENAIALNVTAPNSKTIDTAYASPISVAPKKNIIFLAALLLGLLIPFAIIYIYDLLDTKIKSRVDIEGKISVPFIGDVPKSETHNELISANSRSSSAEAMRIIRTNMDFMLNQVPDGTAKTIFMTSTFPKEGKTFVSVNLAGTFALSGKKVLLVGLDIRNPKLNEYMDLPNVGVTNYLSAKDVDLHSFIFRQEGYEHFDVLSAGVVPPNPAELLMSAKVQTMFNTLKAEYDYIIVDTVPVSLVTDTLLIAKYADAFIYVVRANYLDKRMLKIPESLYKDNKLPNMSILLNDTNTTKGYGYGYGYGYGVDVVQDPWYKVLFKSKKKS